MELDKIQNELLVRIKTISGKGGRIRSWEKKENGSMVKGPSLTARCVANFMIKRFSSLALRSHVGLDRMIRYHWCEFIGFRVKGFELVIRVAHGDYYGRGGKTRLIRISAHWFIIRKRIEITTPIQMTPSTLE